MTLLNCDGKRQTSSFSIDRNILNGSKNIRCENVYTAIYQITYLHTINYYSSSPGIIRSKRNIADTNQAPTLDIKICKEKQTKQILTNVSGFSV